MARRSGPGIAGDFSQWQQIQHTRQTRKPYAHTHTPAGQRNASPGAQATYTRPGQQEKPPTLQPGNIPPGHPRGQQTQAAQPAQKAKRPHPGNAQPQAIQHATHTRPDQFARARARKVLRARYFIFAGRCAQNFCRFGAKKPLPPALGRALEGGQKSDKGRIWGP